jgi:hypothetical protein
MTCPFKRGDLVEVTPWLKDDNTLSKFPEFPIFVALYRTRTQDDLKRIYQKDRDTGNTMDDAGESRIHNKVESWSAVPNGDLPDMRWKCFLVVTDLRPKWTSWFRKPTFLREGLHLETGTKVLFQDRHVLSVISK